MIRARKGRIVLIGSIVGLSGGPGQVNYSSSKAALVGMARSITRELGARGITANVVAPGYVETDMTAALSEDVRKGYLKTIPAGPLRLGGRDRGRGVVHRFRRRGLRLRRGHPGRRWPRDGALSRTLAP